MNLENLNIWQLIIGFGAAQGLFLAFVFFKSSRYQKVSNKFLSLLLLSTAFVNIVTLLFDLDIEARYPIVSYLPINLTVIIPFALLYFVTYLLDAAHKFGKIGYLFLVFIASYFLWKSISVIQFLIGGDSNSIFHTHRFVIGGIYDTVACLQLFIVLGFLLRKLHFFNQSLYEEYSDLESKSLDWLRNALIFIAVLTAFWIVNELNEYFYFMKFRSIMYPILLGITLVIYWVGYTMYLQQDLFESSSGKARKSLKSQVTSEIQPLSDKTEDHYRRLIQLMQDEHLYREPSLSMTMLAERTGLSKGYLSQILNTKEEKNFFEFVNSYRVKEVKRLLEDPAYNHYSVLGIGQEAGFKSKSTFNAVFKKYTAQTPSQYRRQYLSA